MADEIIIEDRVHRFDATEHEHECHVLLEFRPPLSLGLSAALGQAFQSGRLVRVRVPWGDQDFEATGLITMIDMVNGRSVDLIRIVGCAGAFKAMAA